MKTMTTDPDAATAETPFVVVNCKQLVTLRGPARARVGAELRELGIVEDGALLVRGGRIEAAGARSEVERLATPDCEVIDAGRRVVLPGFVDAHAHPVFAGTRAGEFERRALGATYQEIAAAGGGIRSTVRATRAASEDELVETARKRALWFLRTGTTTVEAKSGYGLSVEDELKMLRAVRRLNEEACLNEERAADVGGGADGERASNESDSPDVPAARGASRLPRFVPTFLGAHEIPDEYRERRAEYVRLVVEEMLPRVAGEDLARFCDVFCEQKVFGVEESRRILTAAKSRGLGLRVHADQLTLNGGALLAAELGAATADHLEHTDAEGIRALVAAGVQPVLLPGSVYALGSARYPAAREMVDAGLALVLATDFNPGSSPTPSMPMILSLASTHMRLTPAEAITAATVNAAYSLRIGDETGTLEAGKRADFCVHDADDYRELSYFFGVEHAHATYVAGQLAYLRRP
ncbi:MAG TPA: amidohydrolase family protein [Pyrinomonadaceae bacterium]|nr:amidohydrolase family protein [Pyrinomonadaceae bacterium]